MYFVDSNSGSYFASVTAVMYSISCYTGLRYNSNLLYLDFLTLRNSIWISWFQQIDSTIKIHKKYILDAWLIWLFVVLIVPKWRYTKQIVLTEKQIFYTPDQHKYNELWPVAISTGHEGVLLMKRASSCQHIRDQQYHSAWWSKEK